MTKESSGGGLERIARVRIPVAIPLTRNLDDVPPFVSGQLSERVRLLLGQDEIELTMDYTGSYLFAGVVAKEVGKVVNEELLGFQISSRRLTTEDLRRMAQDAQKKGAEFVKKIVKKLDPKQGDLLGR